jgi:hypothetical protein
MTIRCAVAASRGEALGSLQAAAARSMACTGSATWGLGAGSRTRKDLRRWVKGRAKSVPAPARRGSGYPSSTKACATWRRAFSTVWAPTCLPFPKYPVRVRAANPKSSWLRIAGVVSRSHGSVPQSVQYCCHQRQLMARAAVSTVASSSAARAVSKSHHQKVGFVNYVIIC